MDARRHRSRSAPTTLVMLALPWLLGVAGTVPACDPAGADLCGLDRAEDISAIPGSPWLAVSTAGGNSGVWFVEPRGRQRVALEVGPTLRIRPDGARLGATDCPGPPARLHAGGNDVARLGRRLHLVVINRAAPGTPVRDGDERIEWFELATRRGDAPAATWAGCTPIPASYALNDVALAADGTLFATHPFDRPRTPEDGATLRRRWLAGEPTGFALRWAARDGWSQVAGTALSFANGIAVSRRGPTLAVAGTYSGALLLVDLRDGEVRRVPLPMTPDNVTPLPGGRFVVAGHSGAPVTGVDPCRDPTAVPCGFPFIVAEVDAQARLRRLFEHDGSRIPGASVAVPAAGQWLLGSAFGDRVTVLPRRR